MGSCANDKVTIKPGRNVWVLARTDRDGASLPDVLQTAGGVLKRFLGQASPVGTRSIFNQLQSPKDDPHGARFVIGAARPVLVDAFQATSPDTANQQQPTLAPEVRSDYFVDCPVFRTIAAERPWFVTVEFDWRAPTTVADWPRRAVNFLGIPVDTDQGLDWLLLAAGHEGEAQEPDTSLSGEVLDEGVKVAKAIGKPLLVTVGLLVGGATVVYLLSLGRRSRREDVQ